MLFSLITELFNTLLLVVNTGALFILILSFASISIDKESSSVKELLFLANWNELVGFLLKSFLFILSCSIFNTDSIIEFKKPSFFNTDFLGLFFF